MKEESTERKETAAQQESWPSAAEANAAIQLAERQRAQGRFDEAIESCRKGLGKMPGFLPGRLLLGICYLEKGMITEAKVELEKVAGEIEECFSVYESLTQVYRHEKNNLDKAFEVLQKSLYLRPVQEEVPPKTPEAERPAQAPIQTDTLAEIYVKQGHLDKALSVYQEILAREPENTAVREKYEGLRKRLEEERKATSQQKIISQLEQWLAALSAREDSSST